MKSNFLCCSNQVSYFHYVTSIYLLLFTWFFSVLNFCGSAKLIEIYRNRHNISASSGLNDPAVATGISDLIYESKAQLPETSSIDPDLAMAWAANLGDGMWESNAPAMDRVSYLDMSRSIVCNTISILFSLN